MEYLSVRNWENYQHYRDRKPPWIKLYWSFLCSHHVARLSDVCKWHVVAIMSLASQHDNKIPFDKAWISRVIHANSRINWPAVLGCGMIDCKQDASDALASCKQDAIVETETYKEEIEETPQTPLKGGRASPPARAADETYESWAREFKEVRGVPYQRRKADFVQLASLRKLLGLNGRGNPGGWESAITHYLASPLARYTLADLCTRYDVFLKGPLDRFGKPAGAPGPKGYQDVHEKNLETLRMMFPKEAK